MDEQMTSGGHTCLQQRTAARRVGWFDLAGAISHH